MASVRPSPACRRALVALGVVLAFGAALVLGFSFVGAPPNDGCVARSNCYCESLGSPPMLQPHNSWSSLAFLVLGGFAAVRLCRVARREPGRADLPYLFLFPALAAWLGPAALVYHMTLRFEAGFFDQTSIVLLICYAALFNVQRVFQWPKSPRGFFTAYVAAVLGLGAATFAVNLLGLDLGSWGLSDGIVSVFGTSTIVLTIVSWSGRHAPRHYGERASFARVLFPSFMGAALFVWTTSQTGGLLCSEGGLQGHAVWHLTAALALGAAFEGWLAHPRGVHARARAALGVARSSGVGLG
jgi:hypothetical protein